MRTRSSSGPTHHWTFFRTGGLDQVSLTTSADLLNLEHLDQKLWVALSCPVKGLELDERTLALIDEDKDGRIRVPELLNTIRWAAARLKDPAELLRGADALPLTSINDATPEGKLLLASARQILTNLGRSDAAAISVGESSDTARIFSGSALNGDGVVPPEAAADAETKALIADVAACTGGAVDRTGVAGVTAEKVELFFKELAAFVAWAETGTTAEIAVLGDGTAAAFAAFQAVRAKVDDYFARCRLASFDKRTLAALNRSENDYLALAAKDMTITAEELKDFPLALVAPGRPLPLTDSINPAWVTRLAALKSAAIAPIYGASKTSLDETDWTQLCARFVAYEKWQADKAGASCEKIGLSRAKEILHGKGRAVLDELLARDKALELEFKAIGDVDRLARLHRDLSTLLHNFVNFADFYSRDRFATFQAGTLYLDSRSTELCLRVEGASPLAAMSRAYIAYCTCTRAGSAPINLAACFTQGDSDYLFVGRRGIFYDRQGRDWDAVITSIVENPISIRQAFWSPYKKFVRMIEEQVAKRAAAADAASGAKLATAAEKTAHVDVTKPVEPPKRVDVGTVAAIGVVITGAISALTLILGYVFQLKLWQYPLLFIGLLFVISGPSMLIAWLKLRQRTLGPLLEANGWAINGRVKINIPFGTALTDVAKLPVGARRSLDDPYEDKDARRRKRQSVFLLLVVALAAAALAIRWDHNQYGRYFWQPAEIQPPPSPPAPAPAPPPEAPPAK